MSWEAAEARAARDDPEGRFDRRGKTARKMPPAPRFLPRSHVRIARGDSARDVVGTVVGVTLWDDGEARWRSTIRPVDSRAGMPNLTVFDDDLEPGPHARV